jgi:hypothetical protein
MKIGRDEISEFVVGQSRVMLDLPNFAARREQLVEMTTPAR